LRTPSGLFVYSFYNEPNPETFFSRLYSWLTDNWESDQILSYQQILSVLGRKEGILLVLDGLERVQEEGTRGAFGQITDGRLRDLVLRSADGWLPGVSLLVTTRFYLFDVLTRRCLHHLQVDVHRMSPDAAAALLRARGVSRGSDEELARIAESQGFHALSIDLTGGYIARFLGGDASQFSISTEEPVALARTEGVHDVYTAAVRDQERRFSRVAQRYYEALSERDEAALSLLQRVCLFRVGVDASTLGTIFSGKSDISGMGLAELTPEQLQAKLDLLAAMHLIERSSRLDPRTPGREPKDFYNVHPAVRDGFLATIGPDKAKYHEAVRRGLVTTLRNQPGATNLDQGSVTLLEEIIHHTICAGHIAEAWDIYCNRIGGTRTLFWRLGAFEQGERICRAFVGSIPSRTSAPAALPESDRAVFANDWGLYLAALGRLEEAATCYQYSIEVGLQQKSYKNASTGFQNLAKTLLRAGSLKRGIAAADQAVRYAEVEDSAEERYRSHSIRAHLRHLSGDVEGAERDLGQALVIQQAALGRAEEHLLSYAGVWQCQLLLQRGEIERARAYGEGNLAVVRDLQANHHLMAACELTLASVALRQNRLADARSHLGCAQEWAVLHHSPDIQCWSHVVSLRLEQLEKQSLDEDGEVSTAAVDKALRYSEDYNFGVLYIDLLLLRADILLRAGQPERAAGDAARALERAEAADCGYVWGALEAHRIAAHGLLWRAGIELGEERFAPDREDALEERVQQLLCKGREQLIAAAQLGERLGDPDRDALQANVDALERGELIAVPERHSGHPSRESCASSSGNVGSQVLMVGPEVEWVQAEGGNEVCLRKRQAARSILAALVDEHERRPGRALSRADLISIGWPEEEMSAAVAVRRFHTALWTLRRQLDLSDVILTRHDGYLLHPRLEVRRVNAGLCSRNAGDKYNAS
jgi:tetratricopeptide (TPR) repeat protein